MFLRRLGLLSPVCFTYIFICFSHVQFVHKNTQDKWRHRSRDHNATIENCVTQPVVIIKSSQSSGHRHPRTFSAWPKAGRGREDCCTGLEGDFDPKNLNGRTEGESRLAKFCAAAAAVAVAAAADSSTKNFALRTGCLACCSWHGPRPCRSWEPWERSPRYDRTCLALCPWGWWNRWGRSPWTRSRIPFGWRSVWRVIRSTLENWKLCNWDCRSWLQ